MASALDDYVMELRRRNDGLREAVVLYEDLAAELDRLRAIEARAVAVAAKGIATPLGPVGRAAARYILDGES